MKKAKLLCILLVFMLIINSNLLVLAAFPSYTVNGFTISEKTSVTVSDAKALNKAELEYMVDSWLETRLTKSQIEKLRKEVLNDDGMDAILEVQNKYKISPLLLLSVATMEQKLGLSTSEIVTKGKNLFSLKGKSDYGSITVGGVTYRKYKTYKDSFLDFGKVIYENFLKNNKKSIKVIGESYSSNSTKWITNLIKLSAEIMSFYKEIDDPIEDDDLYFDDDDPYFDSLFDDDDENLLYDDDFYRQLEELDKEDDFDKQLENAPSLDDLYDDDEDSIFDDEFMKQLEELDKELDKEDDFDKQLENAPSLDDLYDDDEDSIFDDEFMKQLEELDKELDKEDDFDKQLENAPSLDDSYDDSYFGDDDPFFDSLFDDDDEGLLYDDEFFKQLEELDKENDFEESEDDNNLFDDVDSDDWFFVAVEYVVNKDLFNGISADEFGPNINMTRGMLVTVLYRLSGTETDKNATFDDVDKNSYYSNAIYWAAKNGIVNGIGNNNFAPNKEITREELATVIAKYVDKMKLKISDKKDEEIEFDDFSETSDYAKEYVETVAKKGLMQGKNGNNFDPKGNATRAEVATLLMRLDK